MIIGFVIALIAVGAGSFYLGTKLSANQNRMPNGQFGQKNFQPGQMMGQVGQAGNQMANRTRSGNMVNGEIIKKDDTSITIKMNDGGSKIVFFSDKVTVNKSIEATKNDVNIGENVMVSGTTNKDGSISAQMIQVRPKNSITENKPADQANQIINQPSQVK